MSPMNVSRNSLPFRAVPLQDDAGHYQVQRLTNNGGNFFYVKVKNVFTKTEALIELRRLESKIVVRGNNS